MSIRAKAFAKINLFLDITGKRPDGYHELDSIFQSVSLCDEISLDLTDSGISVLCDNDELCGEENIVYKACKLYFEEIGYLGGACVKLKKNIPVAAGLGGGSADAAATLLLLNKAFGNQLNTDKLCEIALKLGADVPFCVIGGTARVKGIGEKISSVNTPCLHYVLIKERQKQSTGKMFSVIDNTDYTSNIRIEDMLLGLEKNDVNTISKNLFNAFAYCWDFENMTLHFKEFSPVGVFLSGSGPTVCAIFENEDKARLCAEKLKDNGINAFYAHSGPMGVELV